jgi:hypothetical protein
MAVVDWLSGISSRVPNMSNLATSFNKVSTFVYLMAELIYEPCVTSDTIFSADETNGTDNPNGQSQILAIWCSELCKGEAKVRADRKLRASCAY